MPTATRRRRVDDSEDEDAAGPSSQRRTQASSSRSQAAAATAALSGSASTSNGIDLNAELRPQPLSRAQVPNLRSLIAELKTQDQSILRCIEMLNDTAEQLAEAFRAHEDCPELDQADTDLRELIDAQAEKAIRRSVLEQIAQDLQTGTHMDNPTNHYKSEVQDKLDAYNKQTSRKKYAKNTDYMNFKNIVWVAKNDGAMPPLTDLIPAEDGDEDDSDDEFVVGGATQNFRCPLTTNLLEDPLTNTPCKHSYSRSAIEEYIALGNNRCPASGCTAAVSQRSLKADVPLAKKVAAFKRREEERLIARRQTSTVLY